MAEYFTNNRELIQNLCINTGTSASPTWSNICCASEIALGNDINTDDFYVFCDAIQRHIASGLNLSLNTTLKVDVQRAGVIAIINRLQSAMTSGEVSTLEDVEIKFDMLSSYTDSTLTYTTYTGTAIMNIDEIGGSAESSSEIGVEFNVNGTLSVYTNS